MERLVFKGDGTPLLNNKGKPIFENVYEAVVDCSAITAGGSVWQTVLDANLTRDVAAIDSAISNAVSRGTNNSWAGDAVLLSDYQTSVNMFTVVMRLTINNNGL